MLKNLIVLFACASAFTLNASAPETVIPFRIVNGHMYFNMRVNDGESLQFIFDTGAAANLMNIDTAEKLGIEADTETSVSGASGSTNVKKSNGHSIKVGNLEWSGVNFLLMKIDHLQDEDMPLDGIIGAEILRQFTVKIDYTDSEIRLYKRKKYKPEADWHREKFTLQGFGIPIVQAYLVLPDGRKLNGKYLVDTGAAVSVKFNTPFVNKYDLIEAFGKHYPYSSIALSSSSTDQISRVRAYEVFGSTFENITTRMSRATSGVSSYTSIDGILGLDILRRFNTTYDYKEGVMYLSPSDYFKKPFFENHCGMIIKKAGGQFKVEKVYADSPADQAGIKKGDSILSLDGQSDFTRISFYSYFLNKQKPVDVLFERKSKQLNTNLKPRPMLQ